MTETLVQTRGMPEWLKEAVRTEYVKCIDYKRFKHVKELGEGAYGKVYSADWVIGGYTITVALKTIKVFNNNSHHKELCKEFIKEMTNQVNFHPHILQFFCVSCQDESNYVLVLEYADGGSLKSYLHTNFNGMTFNRKFRFAWEMTSGIMCLHEVGIIHRDLSSDNVLIHRGEIKIADFGISRKFDESTDKKGKEAYFDPYCISHTNKRDEKSDVFSYMATGGREKRIPETPTLYEELYVACWDGDPNKRPSTKTIMIELGELRKNWPEENVIIRPDTKAINNVGNSDETILEAIVLACPPLALVQMLKTLLRVIKDPQNSKERLFYFLCRNTGFLNNKKEINMEIFKQAVAFISLHIMKDYKFDGEAYNPLHCLCDIHVNENIQIEERFNFFILPYMDISAFKKIEAIDDNSSNDEDNTDNYINKMNTSNRVDVDTRQTEFNILNYSEKNKYVVSSYLAWQNNGQPIPKQSFSKNLLNILLATWESDDLKNVAAIFHYLKIKITDYIVDELSLHIYLAKGGTTKQVNNMFYFWDCQESKILKDALDHAQGAIYSFLKDLKKSKTLNFRRSEFEKILKELGLK
ncbi:kinase-like domain-containing protein [Gigaspora margarita]|uniref:Kinase-like domain-containing protein n=1 Tax=Gigaspora margarita TaxID=4874 RepID=A0A8H4EPM0_GIGMA|nr:kinase-like domain-containing protein [Gigaspora margarita]